MINTRKAFFVLIPLFLLTSCSFQEDAGGRAKGKVIFNGQPLTEGNVIFQPAGVGSVSYGVLDANGNFEMKTGVSMKGIYPGEYQVAIESWKIMPEQPDDKGNILMFGLSRIPRKYTNPKNSGLTATIKPQGVNEFTFELNGDEEKTPPKDEPKT